MLRMPLLCKTPQNDGCYRIGSHFRARRKLCELRRKDQRGQKTA